MPEQVRTETPRVTRFVAARVDDIPEGGRLLVEVAGRQVGLFKIEGEIYGLLNRCPHMGGPLCQGQLVNTIVSPLPGEVSLDTGEYLLTCPWHNWEFDVKTGKSYIDPARLRARTIRVSVEQGRDITEEEVAEIIASGRRKIEGPFRAETVPVSVEDDYAVVELRTAQPAAPGGAGVRERQETKT